MFILSHRYNDKERQTYDAFLAHADEQKIVNRRMELTRRAGDSLAFVLRGNQQGSTAPNPLCMRFWSRPSEQ